GKSASTEIVHFNGGIAYVMDVEYSSAVIELKLRLGIGWGELHETDLELVVLRSGNFALGVLVLRLHRGYQECKGPDGDNDDDEHGHGAADTRDSPRLFAGAKPLAPWAMHNFLEKSS